MKEINPLISVIMPVYNGAKYLPEAIESILNQTYKNFEFIVINDGSTDNSLEIIKKYAKLDGRILIISRRNKGLVYSLNEGINIAKGKYIARMDADDISLPNRFERQLEILEKYPHIDIVGCDYELIDKKSNSIKFVKVPKTKEDILFTLCYSVPFAHPSVMIRKKVFDKATYEKSFTEDYHLWCKIFNYNNFYNINECLFLYRYHYGKSFSDSKRFNMVKEELKTSKSFIKKYFTILKENFKHNATRFSGRALVNVFLVYSKKEAINILINNPSLLPLFIFYLFRHFFRYSYWYYKYLTNKFTRSN